MKSRPIDFDFSDVGTYWCETPEFAVMYNAASLVPPPLEIYLCKVMLKARDQLPAHMIPDIDVFIKQETQHYKNHILFNKAVAIEDPEVRRLEKALAADYNSFLENRSLQFNLAYCEGFESASAIPMAVFFGDFQAFWKVSHPKVEAFWKWHMAEEHEHRNTVHDAYHAIYGRGPKAWACRAWLFWWSVSHMMGYAAKMGKILLAHYREGMSDGELAESRRIEKGIRKMQSRNFLRHALAINSPFYSPRDRVPPDEVMKILALDRGVSPTPGGVSRVAA